MAFVKKCRVYRVRSLQLLFTGAGAWYAMTDIKKEINNAGQNLEAKAETTRDYPEWRPSYETLNRAKVKAHDAAEAFRRDL